MNMSDAARLAELHARSQELSMKISREHSLILSAQRDAAKEKPHDRVNINAQFEDEIERLEEWKDYLSNELRDEFSGIQLSKKLRETPRGECLPRSRKMLIDFVRNQFGDADPIFVIIAQFCGVAMMSPFCTEADLTQRRAKLISEVRTRLKPEPDRKGGMAKMTGMSGLTAGPFAPGKKGGGKKDDDES